MNIRSAVYLIIFVIMQGCIPLNNVHTIENYEIKEGKPKARKQGKRLTKFIITNDSQHQIFIKFLEEKYKEKAFDFWSYSTDKKLFFDEDIHFNLTFVLDSKQQRYLDLFNLFSNKSESNPYYNKELDDPYQEGDNIRYVTITITDDSGIDYLAKSSYLRDRLVVYLNSLKKEYGVYRTNYNFINE